MRLVTQFGKAAIDIRKLVFFEDDLRSPSDVRRALRSDIDPIKDDYNGKLRLLKLRVNELLQEIGPSGGGARDASYLDFVYHLEKEAALTGARATLLSLLGGAIQAESWVDDNEIGRADDRSRWHHETLKIHGVVQVQYDNPDFAAINKDYQNWFMLLKAVYADINEVQKREQHLALLLSFAILAVTVVASAGFAALEISAGWAVLGEAAVTTVLSDVVEPAILGKSIDPGATALDFISNAATFGAFRVLNKGFEAAGKLIFPKHAFMQVATVFAGNTLVMAAPALLTRLEAGEWPDHFASFLAASLLVQTTAGAVGKRMGAALSQRRAAQNFFKAMPEFTSELSALQNEWNAAVDTRKLDPEAFASLQKRTAQLAEKTEVGLRLLAGSDVGDAQLEELQIMRGLKAAAIRARLNEMAELVSQYGAGMRAARLALPPPEDVIPGVIVVSGDTREYNQNTSGMDSKAVADRLRRRTDYTVKEDGAVLRLLPPGEDVPRYLMLPAAPDMPPPALKRLVGAPQSNAARGLRIVQEQSAVPPLEYTLTLIAKDHPKTATELLQGIGRHLSAKDTLAIQGIAHFLTIGGAPETLAVALGAGGTASSAEVSAALGRFKTLTASEAQGLKVIVQTRGTGAAGVDSIIGIGAFHDAPGPIFSALAELAPSTEKGLGQLIRELASGAAAERQEGLDALQKARTLVSQGGKPRLQFERPTIGGIRELHVRDASAPPPAGGGDLAALARPYRRGVRDCGTTARRHCAGGPARRPIRRSTGGGRQGEPGKCAAVIACRWPLSRPTAHRRTARP